MKRIFYLIAFGLLIACSEGVEYLPGFEYTDGSRCHIEGSDVKSPLIVYLVKGYDLDVTDNDRFMSEIREAVQRGCDVNEVDSLGLSPLNTAILFSQKEVVEELLELGANPKLKIDSQRKSISGKDSFELSEWLAQNDPSRKRDQVNGVIENHN